MPPKNEKPADAAGFRCHSEKFWTWEAVLFAPPALPGGAEMKTLNRKRFTQQGVDRLRYDKAAAPPSGRIEIEDEACPGLLLRVTPRNLKSFSVIYRVIGE